MRPWAGNGMEGNFERAVGASVKLEGASRVARATFTVTAILPLVVAAVLASAPGQVEAQAAEATGTSLAQRGGDNHAKEAIEAVLSDPVFGQQVPELQWRYRRGGEHERSEVPAWFKPMLDLIEALADAGRVLVLIAGAVLLGVLVYFAFRFYERRHRQAEAARPEVLWGLDVRPESLPDDVVAAARALILAGSVTAALSLLYRGALVALIERNGIEFRRGDTEDDCLRRVQHAIESYASGYFRELVSVWKLCAYAHVAPSGDCMQSLCERWPAEFAAPKKPE